MNSKESPSRATISDDLRSDLIFLHSCRESGHGRPGNEVTNYSSGMISISTLSNEYNILRED